MRPRQSGTRMNVSYPSAICDVRRNRNMLNRNAGRRAHSPGRGRAILDGAVSRRWRVDGHRLFRRVLRRGRHTFHCKTVLYNNSQLQNCPSASSRHEDLRCWPDVFADVANGHTSLEFSCALTLHQTPTSYQKQFPMENSWTPSTKSSASKS